VCFDGVLQAALTPTYLRLVLLNQVCWLRPAKQSHLRVPRAAEAPVPICLASQVRCEHTLAAPP
jgi:hypothetical protein